MAELVETLGNGVVVRQICDGAVLCDNIYCERRHCAPGLKRVVINSCRAGTPQVRVASVPEGLILALDSGGT